MHMGEAECATETSKINIIIKIFIKLKDGRQPNLSMSDCPNECHHQLSAENFASTCV